VSKIGIAKARIIHMNGTSGLILTTFNNRTPAKKPSQLLPQSPIKIFEGCVLNLKKPMILPNKGAENVIKIGCLFETIKIKKLRIDKPISIAPLARPSRPSIIFTALIAPVIIKTAIKNPKKCGICIIIFGESTIDFKDKSAKTTAILEVST